MDVVQYEHERMLARKRLGEAAHGPERLSWSTGCVCQARQLRYSPRDLLGIVLALEQRGDPVEGRLMRCLADDLRNRQVRRTVAVRDATADKDSRLVTDRRHELAHQSRLADARLSDDGDDAATSAVARVGIGGT